MYYLVIISFWQQNYYKRLQNILDSLMYFALFSIDVVLTLFIESFGYLIIILTAALSNWTSKWWESHSRQPHISAFTSVLYSRSNNDVHEYSTFDIKRKHCYGHIFKTTYYHAHGTYHRDDIHIHIIVSTTKAATRPDRIDYFVMDTRCHLCFTVSDLHIIYQFGAL